MNQLPLNPGVILDLLLFLMGFGFIVFIHELGHFLAARWAGIRVLAFAIGFGPAIYSYRRGLGVRPGSSEREYLKLMAARETGDLPPGAARDISPTEYRLNWLPFGGYVRMLGQDDVRPGAVSDASDSYQSVKPWKRMIVISAGVVMNIILAAVLFVVVFMAGLETEPPIVGRVVPGSPAARAVALNARAAGVSDEGLQPGDRIIEVAGKEPEEFSEVVLETTMSKRRQHVPLKVRRAGVREPLEFSILPETGLNSGLLEIGIEPPRSARIIRSRTDAEREALIAMLRRSGLEGVEPGMVLVGTSGGVEVTSFAQADRMLRESDGRPVTFAFAEVDDQGNPGKAVSVTLSPRPALQVGYVRSGKGVTPVPHLLGLVPVMKVASVDGEEYERGYTQGLRTGDVFARIGSIEYPGVAQGRAEIKAYSGKRLPLIVLREEGTGVPRPVSLTVEVTKEGTIGFELGDTSEQSAMVSLPIASLLVPPVEKGVPRSARAGGDALAQWTEEVPAAVGVVRTPGVRIDLVNGATVASFSQLRERLREATRSAFESNEETAEVTLAVTLPGDEGVDAFDPSHTVRWSIPREAIASLHGLGWESPLPIMLFEPEQFVLKATNPADAVRKGIARTKAVMMNTYLTFVRLFEQTVKIEHLKGPVGIAHLGTLIADRGLVWMLFFLALISVNLAVVNFLPLPIVDGGQFLLLVYEQLRGRPAPVGFQNAITLAGLALIGSVFLLVTFNDFKNLLNL